MQDCFRAHPEMYASELENEEDEIEEELRAREAANGSEEGDSEPLPQKAAVSRKSEEQSEKKSEGKPEPTEPTEPTTQKATESNSGSLEEKHRDSRNSITPESTQNSGDEGGDLVPRAAHDATTKK